MIADPCAFGDDYLPRGPVHREGTVDAVFRAWMPTRAGDVGGGAIIPGANSVGKTALAQPALRQLETLVPVERSSRTARRLREGRR